MPMTKKIKLSATVLLLWSNIFSQTTALAQTNRIVEHYKGIPNIAVGNIYVDNTTGTKYVGTEHRLYTFKNNDTTAKIIEKTGIYDIAQQNDNGETWFALKPNTVSNLKGKYINLPIITNKVNAIAVDKNEVWIGTSNGIYKTFRTNDSLVYYGPTYFKLLESQPDFEKINIKNIIIDPKNRKWVGTNEGLFVYDGYGWSLQRKNTNITALATNQNNLYMAGNRKLWVYKNFKKWQNIPLDPAIANDVVEEMKIDGLGNLWLAANELIAVYDKDLKLIQIFNRSNGFNSIQALCIDIDKQNTAWIGTGGRGVYAIRLDTSGSINPAEPLKKQTLEVSKTGKYTLYFEQDQYKISSDSINLIEKIANYMLLDLSLRASIEGHSSGTNKLEKWVVLSEKRAQNIKDYLIERGINKSRLAVVGYGNRRMIDKADVKSVLNRRVEVVLKKE